MKTLISIYYSAYQQVRPIAGKHLKHINICIYKVYTHGTTTVTTPHRRGEESTGKRHT
jgi:hypothetical protein